jgi:hypothetical protein
VSSRGNLQTDFPSADAGKTAYYTLRRVSTRGEKGPWSDITTATAGDLEAKSAGPMWEASRKWLRRRSLR